MKAKEQKYYLTLTAEELSRVRNYIIIARNSFIDKNYPTEDFDHLLLQLMKLGKHRHKIKV